MANFCDTMDAKRTDMLIFNIVHEEAKELVVLVKLHPLVRILQSLLEEESIT